MGDICSRKEVIFVNLVDQYILNHFESHGIPTYAIYDTKGHQTYKSIGFPGNDVIRKELEAASR